MTNLHPLGQMMLNFDTGWLSDKFHNFWQTMPWQKCKRIWQIWAKAANNECRLFAAKSNKTCYL